MKILSIGNSFSQDATRYLHKLAKSAGVNIKTVNLYIGGCSLGTHYYNMLENYRKYGLEFNGENTGFQTTLKEALMSDNWDCITLQQVSNLSPKYESYQPYLNELAVFIKKYCPHSKIFMHQIWAYENNSERLLNIAKYQTDKLMLSDIKKSYAAAASEINADGIIPSGEAMMKALENGLSSVHRDSFHATFGAGRFLLSLLWYSYFTGNSADNISFSEFDQPVSDYEIQIVKKTVKDILEK